MTPTPAWHEADSDRNTTDDNTASAPDAARGPILPASDASGGFADADVLRGRIAALERVSAEVERLRAEVDRLKGRRLHWISVAGEEESRAEAAEAKLRDVEALADELEREATEAPEVVPYGDLGAAVDDATCHALKVASVRVRAVLARSQAPQAPAEQERRR